MTSMEEHFQEALSIIEESDADAILWTGGSEAQVISHMVREYADLEIPHLVIDTGNHYPKMHEFREEYVEDKNINLKSRIYKKMLDEVINNPADPRTYHGEKEEAICPNCEIELEPVTVDSDFVCPECKFEHTVPSEFRRTLPEDKWTIEESCGALKVVPLKRFIVRDGFETLITGQKENDPLVGDDAGKEGHIREKNEPARHTRVLPLLKWEEEQVWAYLKKEFVEYCDLYDEGYRHTDSMCCTDDDQEAIGEHGEGGRDPQKIQRRQELEDMGYI